MMPRVLVLLTLVLSGPALFAQLKELPFPNPEYAVGDRPHYVDAGDLNGDDLADLVVALAGPVDFFGTHFGTTIGILLSRGDGTFEEAFEVAVGQGPNDVIVRDFDGDGTNDIVSTNNDAGTLTVLLNTGDGRQFNATTFSGGIDPFVLDAGDFDEDGDLDLAVAQLGNFFIGPQDEVTIHENDGQGGFTIVGSLATDASPSGIDVGDIDRDGHLDIVVTNFTGRTASIFFGNGDLSFASPVILNVPQIEFQGPIGVAIGDFDGDRFPDLVVSNAETPRHSGEALFFFNLGFRRFTDPVTVGIGRDSRDLGVADLDDDDDLDVVLTNQDDATASVLINDGQGGFQAHVVEVGRAPTGLVLGDFDGDGHEELVTSNASGDSVSVLRGRGDGTFDSEVAYIVPASPRAGRVDDFDGDGLEDVLAVGDPGRMGLLLGLGDGTFKEPRLTDLASRVFDLATGDFDRDGDQDVAIVGRDLEIRWNAGDGTFENFTIVLLNNPGVVSVAAGDVDRDGDPDLAVVSIENDLFGGTTEVAIWLNEGTGTFHLSQSFPYDPGGRIGFASTELFFQTRFHDLDHDGDLDLVFLPNDDDAAMGNGQLPDNRLIRLRGLGDGTFEAPVSIPLPRGSRNLALGDLDGDSHPDIATAVEGDHDGLDGHVGTRVAVLFGRGDATFEGFVSYETGRGPGSVVIADIDGDGRNDLATIDSVGTLTWVRGEGDRRFVRAGSFGSSHIGGSLIATHLDRDGRLDIVSINQTSKQLSVHRCQIPDRPAVAMRYGCGVNPRGSLSLLSGRPALGETFTLGVDNPLATQSPGSRSFALFSLAPDPAFPCGTTIPGLGMDGSGELLVSLVRPGFVGIVFGALWNGPGQPALFSIALPDDPVLLGLSLFVQGGLIDPTREVGLTDGLEILVGE